MVTKNFITKRYINAITEFQDELATMKAWLNVDEDSIDGVEITELNNAGTLYSRTAISEFLHAMRIAKMIDTPLQEMREALEDVQEAIAQGYGSVKK